MNTIIRPIKNNEIPLLTDFLYEAIFIPDNQTALPRTIIQEPTLWRYINNFGKEKDDFCLVAQVDKYIVGAIWTRCIQGFGHINDATPELAMSIYPQYRSKGIGTTLLKNFLDFLRQKNYTQISLSVQKNNYAINMYKKAGFKIVSEDQSECIMTLFL
ncbi:GNAT family N-acetyltransferase [Megamonas hypermegale]|uniref:GNAT family N-acetyltransferase n=1 Tax=Megamonas hypermegale TaxID=158847 RepID=UPI000B38976A|nr:GNAT family N-acetyltransferase [Megamonas hypermegale]MBM6832843.1 GNAT family N-acetyltransferase [Megamonas hypermegale]OUO41701.1 GNAT family N-acetyltransferase [Megamonas hypermegale]